MPDTNKPTQPTPTKDAAEQTPLELNKDVVSDMETPKDAAADVRGGAAALCTRRRGEDA
jgi:hypothetical protein